MPEFAVAPNLTNTLALIERLPLLDKPANAITYSTPTLMFVVYIPSKMGGVLQVGCTKAGAKVVVETMDGNSIANLDGRLIAPAQMFECPIRPGQYQWFTVLVGNVSGSYGMWAKFFEIGIAREADSDTSDPLIPWNFWYFPNANKTSETERLLKEYRKAYRKARLEDRDALRKAYREAYREPHRLACDRTAWAGQALQPCQKYEKAFGVTDVLKWEKLNHDNADGNAGLWWGHCHNAAPASMIFKTPPADGKTFNNVAFLCEELKFFATEYFGNYGQEENTSWGLPEKIGKDGKPISRSGPFQENKPSDDPSSDASKGFGSLIGDFHRFLQEWLLFERRPLLMDLRDAYGGDHSAVWNQAIYRYVAQMWETPGSNNWKDITLYTTLNANQDWFKPDSSGLPATAVKSRLGGGRDAAPDSAIRRDEWLSYRLIFKDDGTVDSKNPKNRWYSVKSKEGTDLHAPRFIFVPKKPATSPAQNGDGNPEIKSSNVFKLLELRDRFK